MSAPNSPSASLRPVEAGRSPGHAAHNPKEGTGTRGPGPSPTSSCRDSEVTCAEDKQGPQATSQHAGTAPNRRLLARLGAGQGGGPRGSRHSVRRRHWQKKPGSLFCLTGQSQSGLASGQAYPPGLVTWGELERTSVRDSGNWLQCWRLRGSQPQRGLIPDSYRGLARYSHSQLRAGCRRGRPRAQALFRDPEAQGPSQNTRPPLAEAWCSLGSWQKPPPERQKAEPSRLSPSPHVTPGRGLGRMVDMLSW